MQISDFVKEQQGAYTYLTYEIKNEDNIDSMGMGMITNNQIEGFVPVVYTQMNDKSFLKYNISGCITAKEYLSGIVDKKRLLGTFIGILDAVVSIEEYMLDAKSLIWDLDYVYVDIKTSKSTMIFIPIDMDGENVNISDFLKNIAFSIQLNQTENIDYYARIINYFNSTSVFSARVFREELVRINTNAIGVEKNVNAEKAKVQVNVSQPVVPQKQDNFNDEKFSKQQRLQVERPKQKTVYSDNRIDTPVMSEQGKTKRGAGVQHAMSQNSVNNANGDEISLFYLLQHYNKDNAAKYKQQKANKKNNKSKKINNMEKNNYNPGYAIPGQNSTGKKYDEIKGSVFNGGNNSTKSNTQMNSSQLNQNYGNGPKPTFTPTPAQQIPGNFGETTVLSNNPQIGETTVLVANQTKVQRIAHIVRKKNNEDIVINKPRFRIGKEKSYVDYFIGDNSAISRSHADIINKEGAFFIIDLNSTNYTYINGTMVKSGDEVPLENGDVIGLANEEFEFRLY